MNTKLQKVLDEIQEQIDILGLILLGSRGKGFENEYSDYDLLLITHDNNYKKWEKMFADVVNDKDFDFTIKSMDDFRNYAHWGNDDEWDRYDYAHVQVLFDRTNGELEVLIQSKGNIPADKKDDFIRGALDGYINGAFRSIKCMRVGNQLGAHLESVSSLQFALDALFALEDRHKPFYGYLNKELEKYSLSNFDTIWLLGLFEKILESANLDAQQELFSKIRDTFSSQGYKDVFDGWDGKDELILEYKK